MDVQGCLISGVGSLQSDGRCSLGFRFYLGCSQLPPRVGYMELRFDLSERGLP